MNPFEIKPISDTSKLNLLDKISVDKIVPQLSTLIKSQFNILPAGHYICSFSEDVASMGSLLRTKDGALKAIMVNLESKQFIQTATIQPAPFAVVNLFNTIMNIWSVFQFASINSRIGKLEAGVKEALTKHYESAKGRLDGNHRVLEDIYSVLKDTDAQLTYGSQVSIISSMEAIQRDCSQLIPLLLQWTNEGYSKVGLSEWKAYEEIERIERITQARDYESLYNLAIAQYAQSLLMQIRLTGYDSYTDRKINTVLSYISKRDDFMIDRISIEIERHRSNKEFQSVSYKQYRKIITSHDWDEIFTDLRGKLTITQKLEGALPRLLVEITENQDLKEARFLLPDKIVSR